MEQFFNKDTAKTLIAERGTDSVLELLLETSKVIASEVELEKVVQKITDIATELSHAEFGAFFYNSKSEDKENYLLYTISGVSKEAFSKFSIPRIAKIFAPTFNGKGTVRYDDVTLHKDFGNNPPHHGLPKGHLPVKSYLAVPVISISTKEVIGGLFFGHSKASVFTKASEKIVEGIAAQGAIAMENARLYEQKKNQEETLRLAVESTGLGTWDFNPLTGELYWSERCKALFGLPPDAFVDYNIFLQKLHPDDKERVDKVVQYALSPESGGEYDIEYRTIAKGRWLRASGKAFYNDKGVAVRFIGTVLDITERKKSQQALEKKSRELEFANADLKNFTYTLSHDIRNPLTSLLMATSMAEDYETVKEYEDIMPHISRCTHKIDSILKGLVAIIQEEDINEKEEDIDIDEVISEIKNELADKISDGCIIRTNIRKKEIRFLKSYFQSILRNLLDNAIKYGSHERKTEILIEVQGHKKHTEFMIRDNGMGIDLNEHKNMLFQPFKRFASEQPGMGIGLFMIKRMLEKRGGSINLESQLGVGTTVRFFIPHDCSYADDL